MFLNIMSDASIISGTKKSEMDSEFKKLIRDKYILSTILMGCVKEFEDMDMEQTIACLDVQEGLDIVKTRDTEFISGTGEKVVMDSVFEVRLPNNDVLGIMVNIEAQGRTSVGYPILNRAAYYAAQLIVDQKGKEFANSDYGRIKKVVSIWCLANPPVSKKNTAVEYRMKGRYIEPLSSSGQIDEFDPVRIVLINMGNADMRRQITSDHPLTKDRHGAMLDMLNIIFSEVLGALEKRRLLEEEYKLPFSDYVSETIGGMDNMLTVEDFWEGRVDMAREEALLEATAKYRKIMIDNYVVSVKAIMEDSDLSVDEAMEKIRVPSEIREDVKRGIEEPLPEKSI